MYLEQVSKTRFRSPNSRSYFENLLFQHFVHNKFRPLPLTENIFLRIELIQHATLFFEFARNKNKETGNENKTT
jgi:hypothetical protein